jgi:hypothetical protein
VFSLDVRLRAAIFRLITKTVKFSDFVDRIFERKEPLGFNDIVGFTARFAIVGEVLKTANPAIENENIQTDRKACQLTEAAGYERILKSTRRGGGDLRSPATHRSLHSFATFPSTTPPPLRVPSITTTSIYDARFGYTSTYG